MEARPFRSVTACVCDDPRRTGGPFFAVLEPSSGGPEPIRASVVRKATFTPITGSSALEPSVTFTNSF